MILKKYLENIIHGNEIKDITIKGVQLNNKNASNVEKKDFNMTNVEPEKFEQTLKTYIDNLQNNGEFSISLLYNNKPITINSVYKDKKIVFSKSEELQLNITNKTVDEFIKIIKNKIII